MLRLFLQPALLLLRFSAFSGNVNQAGGFWGFLQRVDFITSFSHILLMASLKLLEVRFVFECYQSNPWQAEEHCSSAATSVQHLFPGGLYLQV